MIPQPGENTPKSGEFDGQVAGGKLRGSAISQPAFTRLVHTSELCSPLRVIFDPSGQSCRPVYVRFTPKVDNPTPPSGNKRDQGQFSRPMGSSRVCAKPRWVHRGLPATPGSFEGLDLSAVFPTVTTVWIVHGGGFRHPVRSRQPRPTRPARNGLSRRKEHDTGPWLLVGRSLEQGHEPRTLTETCLAKIKSATGLLLALFTRAGLLLVNSRLGGRPRPSVRPVVSIGAQI
jgi:hypothetical protein